MRTKILMLIFILSSFFANAQQKWNLQSIVEYAMNNNIGVRLSDVQKKNAELTYAQSKLSQYPNASFNMGASVNSGNRQDPVSFQRVTQTSLTSNLGLQAGVDIFNWYSKKNTILANEWELKAASANSDKLRYDIALNAANAYLQVLLAIEQAKITDVQLAQTSAQLNNTTKLVKAGSLPQLNQSQLEAQLASDSVNYISANGNITQSILNLKSYMSMDAASLFEIETPELSKIPIQPIAELLPETVYASALTNQPLQKYNDYRYKAAEKMSASAKASMYPSISGFLSLGSNFFDAKTYLAINGNLNGYANTPYLVNIDGTDYSVKQPIYSLEKTRVKLPGYFSQIKDNFAKSIGLSISVPIFNSGSLKTNYKKAKLNEESLKIQKEQDNLKLKQDIYAAYNSALVANEKFNASKKIVSTNETTYLYAQKRFNVGMLSTYDLITSQNNLLKAKLEYTLNEFDYVFKMKVLEYYKGLGLGL